MAPLFTLITSYHTLVTPLRYASLAHLNPDQIGNVLARATTNVLMIKNGTANVGGGRSGGSGGSSGGGGYDSSGVEMDIPDEHDSPWRTSSSGGGGGSGGGSQSEPRVKDKSSNNSQTDKGQGQQLKRSLWIPDDSTGPRVWFVAPRGAGLPPPATVQRGPFRVSELMEMLDCGELEAGSLVAPSMGDEGGNDEDRFDAVVDTGRWRELKDYFQLAKQMLSPGRAIYAPAEVATKSLMMLAHLAFVHRSVNFKGSDIYVVGCNRNLYSSLAVTLSLSLSLPLPSLSHTNPHLLPHLPLFYPFLFLRSSGTPFFPIPTSTLNPSPPLLSLLPLLHPFPYSLLPPFPPPRHSVFSNSYFQTYHVGPR